MGAGAGPQEDSGVRLCHCKGGRPRLGPRRTERPPPSLDTSRQRRPSQGQMAPGPLMMRPSPGSSGRAGTVESRAAKPEDPLPTTPCRMACWLAHSSLAQAGHAGHPGPPCMCLLRDAGLTRFSSCQAGARQPLGSWYRPTWSPGPDSSRGHKGLAGNSSWRHGTSSGPAKGGLLAKCFSDSRGRAGQPTPRTRTSGQAARCSFSRGDRTAPPASLPGL